jgi:hypothetical protein
MCGSVQSVELQPTDLLAWPAHLVRRKSEELDIPTAGETIVWPGVPVADHRREGVQDRGKVLTHPAGRPLGLRSAATRQDTSASGLRLAFCVFPSRASNKILSIERYHIIPLGVVQPCGAEDNSRRCPTLVALR